MGRFITAKSRMEQTENGYWKTIDNELFLDDDGSLYIVPRYFWSDGYTFPGIVMAILGDKNFYDARPAHGHDLGCRFHQVIRVTLSLAQLKMQNLLRTHEDKDGVKIICEDIPLEYLSVEKKSKNWVDNFFKRMMKAAGVPKLQRYLIRLGVFFNFNWYFKTGKKSILEYNIYEEDIGLVNGL